MREYHQAQDRGAPFKEVERLRLLAGSLYKAVIDYPLIQAGWAQVQFHLQKICIGRTRPFCSSGRGLTDRARVRVTSPRTALRSQRVSRQTQQI